MTSSPGPMPAASRASCGARRPHVTGSITHQHLIPLVAVAVTVLTVSVDGNALVVDLDLLARLQVVVDDHLSTAADERPTNLDGRQPVDVQVSDQIVFEEEI